MELLTPISPVAFDRTHSLVPRPYYSTASATSSSSPDLTTATTVSTTHASDSDDEYDSSGSGGAFSSRIKPKVEELDEDKHNNGPLHELTDASSPVGVVSQPEPPPLPRKKRGRPRKHPIVDATTDSKKASHARSKTGCGTCRRRKKKCDETKPACMNCEKNNVVCDGYEPKQRWRSGKEKALQLRSVPNSLPDIAPAGVENELDREFLWHFSKQIGERLSLIDESNPFKIFILPMATENLGVMHSVLFLSSSCFVATGPGASNDVRARNEHHRSMAFNFLLRDSPYVSESLPQATKEVQIAGTSKIPASPNEAEDTVVSTKPAAAPSMPVALAQALILCLETVAAGNREGNYRPHLNAMKAMLLDQGAESPNDELRKFILEFLLYHDYSSSITSLKPTVDARSLNLMKDFELPKYMIPAAAGSLLGVMDGLFGLISRIRALRDRIRAQKVLFPGFCWLNDAEIQTETYAIDLEIRNWKCRYPPGSPRFQTSLLYRQCTWVYLWRTVFASRPHVALKAAVDDGLKLLNELPSGEKEDSGAIQSVLLMPVFLIGCAAFEEQQRRDVRQAFIRLQRWSSLGNIKYAQEIVEEMWDLMDQGREEESWDWEKLIFRRGWDLLVT